MQILHGLPAIVDRLILSMGDAKSNLLTMKDSYHSLSFQSLTTCLVFGIHRSLTLNFKPR